MGEYKNILKEVGGHLQGNVAITIYKCWTQRVVNITFNLYNNMASIT
jgi:hypothetical protein